MATFNQKDIELLFVGGDAALSSGGIDTLNLGEIGVFTPAGTRMTEALAATEETFMIVQDRGTNPNLISSRIKKATVASALRKLFVAATEQVDLIGFNGTSGAIDVINDNLYHVRISLRQHLTSNHGGVYLKHGIYQSAITANEADIAAGLHNSLIANFSREPDQTILFERLYSVAALANTSVETYAINNGSKFAAVSAAPTVVAGDVIRLTGNTTTDATYVVVNVDVVNNIIELDAPYQGADIAAPGVVAFSEALVPASNWGIRLTGVPQKFRVGKLHYGKAAWDLTLDKNDAVTTGGTFGNTPQLQTSSATSGSGTEEYVRELEWFAQGNEGDFYRMGEPNIFGSRTDVTVGTEYNLIHLTIREIYRDSIVANPINKSYTIALPRPTPAYANNATPETLTRVLEVLVFGALTGDLAV